MIVKVMRLLFLVQAAGNCVSISFLFFIEGQKFPLFWRQF